MGQQKNRKNNKTPPTRKMTGAQELRAEAEKRFADRGDGQQETRPTEELLYELQVHQIELEMQNEALRQTQIELEESRDQYAELYNAAPVGYLTLSAKGIVTKANQAAAAMFGLERDGFSRRGFGRFVARDELDRWDQHLAALRQSGGRQVAELRLARPDGSRFHAYLESVSAPEPDGDFSIRTALVDITTQKQAEEALRYEQRELAFHSRVAQVFITHSHDTIFAEVLKVVLERMASRYGIFGYLDEEGTLVVPSMTAEIWDKCQVFNKTHHFPKETWSDSSWPRALREKRTMVSNEASGLTPEGHLAITRHISLPIIFQDEVIGLFLVANKETDYTDEDVRLLESLAAYLAPVLHARIAHKRAEELVANILEAIDEGVITIDRDFRILSANRAYAESMGRPLGDIIGHHCYKISHHFDTPCYQHGEECPVKHVFDTGQARTALHTHYDARGRPIYVETKAFPLRKNEDGEVQTAIEIVVDVTEKKAREAEISRLAFFDPLTRLPNRQLLLERLKYAFAASDRNGQHGALLFLDLDHFKTINDTRGHSVGDRLLVMVAQRLQAIVREGDSVSRQGGDEFVVLLEDLNREEEIAGAQAGHVAEKIRAALGEPFDLGTGEHRTTTSIGICLFQGREIPVDDLLKYADNAMYQSKHSGRNRVSFFDPVLQAAIEERSGMEADLRWAITAGEFQLYYQPQVDSERRLIGAEALLSWTHPVKGLVPPGVFIPLAEESDLILEIGRWVLYEACRRLGSWSGLPGVKGLRLAVNISARQFRQPEFVAEVRQVLEATGIDPGRLKLELTEGLVLTDVAGTVAKMHTLRELGLGFSMDDFGTGYSSLSQLKRLPLEQLKIDQSFVRDIGSDPHDTAIVETIIAMGRTLGLNVIAEGVETEEQLTFLKSHGCHVYQGYLFNRPLTAAEFTELLHDDRFQIG